MSCRLVGHHLLILAIVVRPSVSLGQSDKSVAKNEAVPGQASEYSEEEVSIRNEKANVVLAGTIAIPKGSKISDIVVLVAGQGPHSRDCLSGKHNYFGTISAFLARRGIAVLRMDKRGVAKST